MSNCSGQKWRPAEAERCTLECLDIARQRGGLGAAETAIVSSAGDGTSGLSAARQSGLMTLAPNTLASIPSSLSWQPRYLPVSRIEDI